MRRMIYILIANLIVFPALAQSQPPQVQYNYVRKVLVKSDNYLYVAVAGNYNKSHNCPNLAYARSSSPITDDLTKAYLQAAIASFLSRSKIRIGTNGCVGSGSAVYPQINYIQLEQD